MSYFPGLIGKIFIVILLTSFGLAQNTAPAPADQKKPGSQQPEVPAAGGPQGDTGTIAIPKKNPDEQPPKPEPKPKIKNPAGLEDYSIHVSTQLVTVPISVVTKDGQFIPGLKADNFKVFEDGKEQKVQKMELADAPITAVMLLEFSYPNFRVNQQIYGAFMYDMFNAAYGFAQSLKKEDWVAVVSYDMKPTMVVDFTQDKRQVLAGLNSMQIPLRSDSNVFDALYDTLDRLEGVEGHKYILLVGSGIDTFSKLTLDKILAKVKSTRDVTIYTISTGWAAREYFDSRGAFNGDPTINLTYLQADNQMRAFASLTGGRYFQPRFTSEIPGIMADIAQTVRNQYMVYYRPTNPAQDGSYRKLKVELQAPDGGPLTVQNEKGKKLKYQVIYREGYRARQVVE
jgi:VWFA-related protein